MSWRRALTPRRLRQLWYVPLLGGAMALMLARVLLIARALDISGFGQFSAGLLLSSSFGMLACLGLHSMLQRDLPMLLIRRRERRGAVQMAQCLLIAVALGAAGAVAGIAGWSIAGLPPSLMAIGMLHGLSQQTFLVVTVESRSRGEPLRFAVQMIVRSLLVTAIGVGTAAATGSASAALGAEAVVTLALTLVSLRAVLRRAAIDGPAAFGAAFRRMRHVHWRSALAFLAISLVGFVMLYADRWAAAQLLDTTRFALYAFAWTVLMIAQSLQLIVNTSVYPMIARRFAASGAATAFRISAVTSTAALVVGAVLAVPAWWVMDLGVRHWLAPYAAASPLMALFVGAAVLRVSDFWTSFLMIVGLEARLLAINIGVASCALLAWLAWARPWQRLALDLWDVGLLALLLSAGSYIAAALMAWHAARR